MVNNPAELVNCLPCLLLASEDTDRIHVKTPEANAKKTVSIHRSTDTEEPSVFLPSLPHMHQKKKSHNFKGRKQT